MLGHVAAVAAAEVTVGTLKVVARVFAHVGVQVALGIGAEFTLVARKGLQVGMNQAVEPHV